MRAFFGSLLIDSRNRWTETPCLPGAAPGLVSKIAHSSLPVFQVICEKADRSDIPDIDKKKYLVPADLSTGAYHTACCPVPGGSGDTGRRQRRDGL